LPVLTGGAYLHVSKDTFPVFEERAKDALALFGSTSPSYLILQSLDMANAYIADGYKEKLASYITKVGALRELLIVKGYTLCGDEPLKLTIASKSYGYRGFELAQMLRERGVECEFADPDYCVMMLTPEIGLDGLLRLINTLVEIPKRKAIDEQPPKFGVAERVMSVREAVLSPAEVVSVGESVGRTLANATVGCPPAVPIIVCGERIDETAVRAFEYYGIDHVTVVRETK